MFTKITVVKIIRGIASAVFFVWASASFAEELIKMAGSSTIRPIIRTASIPFGKSHGVAFDIGGGGSSHGVKSVAAAKVNIGNASRYLKEKEKKKWPDLVPHLIGSDGVAVIVHKSVKMKNITKKQMQDIYTGKVRNWKEIGGPDLPIFLVSKEEGRSTLDLFLKYADLEAKTTSPRTMIHRLKGEQEYSETTARIIGSNRRVLLAVGWKKGAIGYVSVGDAIHFAEKTKKITLPNLDGVEATITNVKNGSFPITRPLHVVTKGPAQGIIKKFIDFLLSAAGQEIVKKRDFVPIN
ncbi:MAG: phosphate ABC transporter substrate-binding protein [Gammaproteobacteria bacterium]|nr:phosphate ABC transporter substrate-binding protein [Gammaproteobacteria bacterium]